jgi:hypothetical protein
MDTITDSKLRPTDLTRIHKWDEQIERLDEEITHAPV